MDFSRLLICRGLGPFITGSYTNCNNNKKHNSNNNNNNNNNNDDDNNSNNYSNNINKRGPYVNFNNNYIDNKNKTTTTIMILCVISDCCTVLECNSSDLDCIEYDIHGLHYVFHIR